MSLKTILAIDTSETACSVALWNQQQCTELMEPTARKHSEVLLPMVEALLKAQQLKLSQVDCLAFACGPGAFTGLRLGAAAVQAFHFALGIPVIPVSTLLAQAYAGYRQLNIPLVLSTLDARMGEIYVAAYQFSSSVSVSGDTLSCCRYEVVLSEQVMSPVQLPLYWQPQHSWCAVGSGCIYSEAIQSVAQLATINKNLQGSAVKVLSCAIDLNLPMSDHSGAMLPVYLRNQVVG